jgi:hypothetical protein
MGPLAPVEPTSTDRFATMGACSQCHLAGDTGALRDDAGHDISPVGLFRSSMMAFAARDPYYLAVVSEERLVRPGIADAIDDKCTKCHAPAGALELEASGGHLTLEGLATGTSPAENLGRDGVTCSLCHQLDEPGLSGAFDVGYDRAMLGPHEGPDVEPMQFFVEYTPTYAEGWGGAELCASCHTVVVPIVDAEGQATGGDFLEQAPYFEWLSSSFAGTTPCNTCHLPSTHDDGTAIASVLAKYPDGLPVRTPFGKHRFVGGNATMLRALAAAGAWTGATVEPAELELAALEAEAHLRGAASLTVVSRAETPAGLEVVVRVDNLTGHKLPTGYPSRRMWLHVRGLSASGALVWESGGYDLEGRLVDRAGAPVEPEGDYFPHVDRVSDERVVQLWEAIASDASGAPTHRALGAVGYLKDDRVLPQGFAPAGDLAEWLGAVGTSADPSFSPGHDEVTYVLPSEVATVELELVYQTVPPWVRDRLALVPTGAAVKLTELLELSPSTPLVMATVTSP